MTTRFAREGRGDARTDGDLHTLASVGHWWRIKFKANGRVELVNLETGAVGKGTFAPAGAS